METLNIFLTDPMGETLDEFVHDNIRFSFGTIPPDGPKRLTEGPVWVFVDWVLPDLSGLEMCRRLRADPRTTDAHVTMVLVHDDQDDRRRALRAGADAAAGAHRHPRAEDGDDPAPRGHARARRS